MPRFLFFILFFYSINAFSYTNNRIYSYYLSESEAFSACQANELGDGNLCINGFAVNFVAPQCTNTSGRVGNLFRPIINNVRDEYRYVFCTPDQSCPNVDEVLDPQTGQCYLPQPQISQCSDYGFDPTSFIPLNSVCQNDGSSYPDMQCLNGETTYDLPRCNLALCPDGSTINAANNETCPVPKQCFDGSIKYGDEVCPTPFICPDGRQVSSQELCDSPVEESHECSNGDIIPVSQLLLAPT